MTSQKVSLSPIKDDLVKAKKAVFNLRELLNNDFSILKDLQKEIIEELVQKTLSLEGDKVAIIPANFLLDITTGFGKSYLQIVYAYILESKKIDYSIILPGRLVEQFESSISKIVTNKDTVLKIKKKIKNHKDFIESAICNNKKSSKSILIIDEIDEILINELYNKRINEQLLSNEITCVLSTATAPEPLYNYHAKKEKNVFGFLGRKNTKNTLKDTHVISVSHSQKLKCFDKLDNYITQKKPSSLMSRINRKSRLLPYIVLNLISTSCIISVKIYFNTVAVHLMKDYLISINLYNFYLYVFLINPIAGLISLLIAWIFIISPVNFLINIIANRDVISIFLANLEDHHFASPAYDNLFDSNETFVFHEDKNFSLDYKNKKDELSDRYKISRIQEMLYSPKTTKELIIARDTETHDNIFNAFCDSDRKGIICQNGKEKTLFTIFEKLRLGKDLGTQYDHSSFEETQRVACKSEYKKAASLAAKTYGVSVEELCKDIDFSDRRQYIKYVAMHGIINNALLIILKYNKKDYSIESPLMHNLNYEQDIKDSIKKLSEDLKNKSKQIQTKKLVKEHLGYDEEIKQQLEDGNEDHHEKKIVTAISDVIDVLITSLENNDEKVLYPIIFNRNTDKRLHDMMEKGDNFQILDDLYYYYQNTIKPLSGNQNLKKENLIKFLKESCLPLETIEENNYSLLDQILLILEKKKKDCLFDFFEKNNLFKKINENIGAFKLSVLRNTCKTLSIQFTEPCSRLSIKRHIDLEKGKKLFKNNLLGILVDTDMKLATGFNDKNLYNGSLLSNNKYGLDPRLVEQAKGRLRGMQEAIPGFFRIITNNKTATNDYAASNCEKLFRPTKTHLHLTILNLPNTFTEQIIQSIEPSTKELNLKKILEIIKENFELIHNFTNHDITESKEKFTKTLDLSVQHLSSYGSKIKNSSGIYWLYIIPYCLFYYFIKILYYSWSGLDYLSFCISTIGVKSDTKNFSIEELIYVHVIKNYKIEECFRDYQIIKNMDSLLLESSTKYGVESEQYKQLLKDFIDTPICKKALRSVLKLDGKFIDVILEKLQTPDKSIAIINKLKLEYKIFLEGNHANYPENFESALSTLKNIAKEILTLHAWYHDSCTELILVEKPLLIPEKIDNYSIFYHRNVGNPFRFLGSTFQLFRDKDAVKYRSNFGNIPRVVALYISKWFIFIVIIPQIPYLFLVISQASALSTMICAFFVLFIRYSSKIREFLFNNSSMACNELKVIANASLITKVEKEVSKVVHQVNNLIKNNLNVNSADDSAREKFTLSAKDIKEGTYSSGAQKFFVREIEPCILEQTQTIG